MESDPSSILSAIETRKLLNSSTKWIRSVNSILIVSLESRLTRWRIVDRSSSYSRETFILERSIVWNTQWLWLACRTIPFLRKAQFCEIPFGFLTKQIRQMTCVCCRAIIKINLVQIFCRSLQVFGYHLAQWDFLQSLKIQVSNTFLVNFVVES